MLLAFKALETIPVLCQQKGCVGSEMAIFANVQYCICPADGSDEFQLEISGSSKPELWRFRAEPSRAGALQFSSWNRAEFFLEVQSNFQISTSIMITTNSNQLHDNLYEFI